MGCPLGSVTIGWVEWELMRITGEDSTRYNDMDPEL